MCSTSNVSSTSPSRTRLYFCLVSSFGSKWRNSFMNRFRRTPRASARMPSCNSFVTRSGRFSMRCIAPTLEASGMTSNVGCAEPDVNELNWRSTRVLLVAFASSYSSPTAAATCCRAMFRAAFRSACRAGPNAARLNRPSESPGALPSQ
ncbi:hypothetical protein Mx8p62 [Myxococcus phage Mx8]|uniref:p62 n=1 Tax=Myxococcus phage Mx8 TaxID=49964 RepID=Q94MQ7_9CAUD|nr:hypothetical protein Mx8p62 [Myxococcus phage Mx8]AAK94397.1 p62 [Myxococcus phage Mx8]